MALVFIVLVALALKISAIKVRTSAIDPQQHDTVADLIALVRPSSTEESGVYSEAFQILTGMQASPSCNRLAASKLLNSCQFIQGSKPDNESFLDDTKSIYAAQLAMCEITSAGAMVPQRCRSLAPEHGANRQQEHIEKQQLSVCLQALESRPQWWTSYSNNRQNAVVMCQAARVEIEKDDLIELHKSMVQTNSDVSLALSKASKEATERLSGQKQFAVAIDTFQKQLLYDLEASSGETEYFFEKLMKSMDCTTQKLLSKLSLAIRGVETEAAGVNKNLVQTNNEVVELQNNIGKVFQQAAQDSSELAAIQARQWDLSRGLATGIQNSLESIESMREAEMYALHGAFENIHGQLQISNELISQMYSRQDKLDERLLNLDRSFAGLETKAEAFLAAQNSQAEMQTHLHDQMRTDMQVTRGLLSDITSSATKLQSAVEDTSTKIAHMAAIGGLTDTILWWGWLAMVILITYQFSPRNAGYAVTASSVYLLITKSSIPSPFNTIPPDTVFIHYASGYEISALLVLKTTAIFTTLLAIGILYSLRERLQKLSTYIISMSAFQLGLSRDP